MRDIIDQFNMRFNLSKNFLSFFISLNSSVFIVLQSNVNSCIFSMFCNANSCIYLSPFLKHTFTRSPQNIGLTAKHTVFEMDQKLKILHDSCEILAGRCISPNVLNRRLLYGRPAQIFLACHPSLSKARQDGWVSPPAAWPARHSAAGRNEVCTRHRWGWEHVGGIQIDSSVPGVWTKPDIDNIISVKFKIYAKKLFFLIFLPSLLVYIHNPNQTTYFCKFNIILVMTNSNPRHVPQIRIFCQQVNIFSFHHS